MSVKSALAMVVGKTITGVIVKESNHSSCDFTQLFLVFSNNTYYEIYAHAPISTAGGLDPGGPDEVREYMNTGMKVVFDTTKAIEK